VLAADRELIEALKEGTLSGGAVLVQAGGEFGLITTDDVQRVVASR
jgi:hypothetical protein